MFISEISAYNWNKPQGYPIVNVTDKVNNRIKVDPCWSVWHDHGRPAWCTTIVDTQQQWRHGPLGPDIPVVTANSISTYIGRSSGIVPWSNYQSSRRYRSFHDHTRTRQTKIWSDVYKLNTETEMWFCLNFPHCVHIWCTQWGKFGQNHDISLSMKYTKSIFVNEKY